MIIILSRISTPSGWDFIRISTAIRVGLHFMVSYIQNVKSHLDGTSLCSHYAIQTLSSHLGGILQSFKRIGAPVEQEYRGKLYLYAFMMKATEQFNLQALKSVFLRMITSAYPSPYLSLSASMIQPNQIPARVCTCSLAYPSPTLSPPP